MSDTSRVGLPVKEHWGSKFGVVLAVAGSAVGLGNFLRFPGQAVNNGGGAFMIPYIISFVVLGIPIAWCEWTMGRLGARFGQNSAPGIMYALWRRPAAKFVGALTLVIPIVIYMYYVVLEAWCLDYAIEFARGGFAQLFGDALAAAPEGARQADAIVGATNQHWTHTFGMGENGALFQEGRTVWLVLVCFLVNFFIIYLGVTRGIEAFCKYAMPLLILCALIILGRVLTLPNITHGLGFMWNPDWSSLKNPSVWLAAAGQIFFSLSVGFGLILCYASYLRPKDDVVLTALSASSMNEFCEVILGGLIVVPTAFLFLGAENASAGTFGLGFVTVPAIMHFMPGGPFWGSLVGAMWFGLLFLAAVTSSLSMLQPAIAFLEDGFGVGRRASVALLGVLTAVGCTMTMYFSRNLIALDHTDFWCNLLMIVAATCQVLIFGWIIGAERGVKETNRGADFPLPRFMPFVLRYVTPLFLIAILVMWTRAELPGRIDGMSPSVQGRLAEWRVYESALRARLAAEGVSPEQIMREVEETLGTEGAKVPVDRIPAWLQQSADEAHKARRIAAEDANVARLVFIGVLSFLLLLTVLSDIACRKRIGQSIAQAERSGAGWEAAR
jgi:SNF family Na+-dependent transporter